MLKSANRRTGASAADRTSSRRAVLRQGLKWVASLVLLGGLGIGVWCVAVAEKLPPSETPAHAITNALLHPVVIRRPEGPPMLPTGLTNSRRTVLKGWAPCSARRRLPRPSRR
jgi:hypothetical protein